MSYISSGTRAEAPIPGSVHVNGHHKRTDAELIGQRLKTAVPSGQAAAAPGESGPGSSGFVGFDERA